MDTKIDTEHVEDAVQWLYDHMYLAIYTEQLDLIKNLIEIKFLLLFAAEQARDSSRTPEKKEEALSLIQGFAERCEMPGLATRIKRELESPRSWIPKMPEVNTADLTPQEAIRERLAYIRAHKGSLGGGYRKLWEAGTLAIQHPDLAKPVWTEAMLHNETYALAAFLACTLKNETWQGLVLERVQNRWRSDHFGYHAMRILSLYAELDDEVVNALYTTKQPLDNLIYA